MNYCHAESLLRRLHILVGRADFEAALGVLSKAEQCLAKAGEEGEERMHEVRSSADMRRNKSSGLRYMHSISGLVETTAGRKRKRFLPERENAAATMISHFGSLARYSTLVIITDYNMH